MTAVTETSLVVTRDDHDVEQIARSVAEAKTKEELFLLLGRIIHGEYLMEGAAEGLVKSLHQALILREGKLRKYYRTSLSHNGALQCFILVCAIEMLLRCSPDVLADSMEPMRQDLVPTLPRLLQLFVSWDGDETLRSFAISNTVKVLRRIGPFCSHHHTDFVLGLLCVLKGHVAHEIQVDTANTISFILNQQERSMGRKKLIETIQSDSSLIISTLSTAAMKALTETAEEILSGLFNFAVNSHAMRVKMAKRRCTILAIGKHLTSSNVENRKLALNICKCLLNEPDSIENTAVGTYNNTDNFMLLLEKVIQSATDEPESMLKLYAISLLGDAVANSSLPIHLVDSIMSVLEQIANSDGQDGPVTEASITYMKAASAMSPREISNKNLATIADFTTLPYARSRAMAITTLEMMTADDDVAEVLLRETEMLENFSLIISYGSDEDCADAMNVLRLLAGIKRHHPALCQNSSFLSALVELVTKEEVINQSAYVNGIETVLTLLSNNDNVSSFLPFIDLLPTLVSLANTTTDDEALKEKLVSAIVRLSAAILDI